MKCLLLIPLCALISCSEATMQATKPSPARLELTSMIYEQVKDKPVLVIEKVVEKPIEVKTKDGKVVTVKLCDKSTMPGYVDGQALDAAVDGFNARGVDIDNCNKRILEFAEQVGAKVQQ